MEMPMMDTFFIPPAMLRNSVESTPSRPFLKSWKEEVMVTLPKPKSILIVSAHWDTCHPTVNLVHHNQTMYDYENFPAFMDEWAPQLAKTVKELLTKSGFENVHEDGAQADIPVCQMSVQSGKDGTHHYNIGKALSPLRSQGVLIIGSGGATNNVPPNSPPIHGPVLSWALEFDSWLKDSLLSGSIYRHEDIIDYEKKAPHAKMAHPEPDHMYPLLVALGSAGNGAKAELIHQLGTWLPFFCLLSIFKQFVNCEAIYLGG
ncbi:unnamed protein product [Camellia sinensis]